jgi:2-iminobutanoate/2-iminopropanoate deaminase
MEHYAKVNEAYAQFFTQDPKPVSLPVCLVEIRKIADKIKARTCVAVAELPLGAEMEIEAIVSLA